MLHNVTVFDFETTGTDPRNDRVIEIAAIRIVNGEVVSGFSTLVRQDLPGGLPVKVIELTGITTDMMMGGMDESTAFKILRRMIGDHLIVAHNAAFDMAFLHFTLQRLAGLTFQNPFIDTVTIARDRHPYPHKLGDVCERYGIQLEGAHRALNDVWATWELLKAMHAEKDVSEYINRLGYLEKYGPPIWSPEHANLVPMRNRYENAG